MSKRTSMLLNVGLVTVLAWIVLGQPAASGGGGVQYANFPVPAFAGREYSVHNATGASDCAAFVALQNGGENRGDLDNGEGSYFAFLRLPQGAKVTALNLFVNDADDQDDVFAYLIRKKIADGLTPATLGYKVMAQTKSSGAVTATIREFSDETIDGATIDNAHFSYYIELVDCGIPEPYTVQVAYTD